MSRTTLTMTEPLIEYLRRVGFREPELLARLREETAAMPRGGMQISPEQGQFMSLLVQFGNVRRAVEIGTFTGYSSLCVALAMPPEGRLVACDVSDEWTSVARRYWHEAGVADRIELRLGPALATLDALLLSHGAGSFDFAFIDADKSNYQGYYERVLKLLRVGGLVAVDNVLWSGQVADPTVHDEDTDALRSFNEALKSDTRIHLSMLPVGDGLTLGIKTS